MSMGLKLLNQLDTGHSPFRDVPYNNRETMWSDLSVGYCLVGARHGSILVRHRGSRLYEAVPEPGGRETLGP
jgi:hypothetical protein